MGWRDRVSEWEEGTKTFSKFALIMIVRGLSNPLLLPGSPLAICSPSILRSKDPHEVACVGLNKTEPCAQAMT